MIVEYHQRTKHHFHRYAAGPGYLDWATQPDPFRRYAGARLLPLEHLTPGGLPLYEPAFVLGNVPPAPLDRRFISQLFYDSLALSAWKRAGTATWALRVNPSSGNLHPTEGYLVSGPLAGLCERPLVAHYAPKEHALEVRAEFPPAEWEALSAGLPEGSVLVGLTSIHWREAWKYGERAFRYCQHDVGHALGALSIAAAGLGWTARLVEGPGTLEIGALLGVRDPQGAEAEHPDCLVALSPAGAAGAALAIPEAAFSPFAARAWEGRPNPLSPDHVPWPAIEAAAAATVKPRTGGEYGAWEPVAGPLAVEDSPLSLRTVIHQRRSAVDMDGRTGITAAAFYQILRKTLAGPGQVPFQTLPWRPKIHLALFVHRVQGLDPGLYLLVRDPSQTEALRAALRREFAWEKPAGCPPDLPLYRLVTGDARAVAARVSCGQEIAGDGCFSLGMVAEFAAPLAQYGPWFYPRLFWECGLVGQVLYLEAEASGIRATGIGCYFDDAVHSVFGLEGTAFQSLYHFTLGGPVDDPRLLTLPPYPGPA